ncbi:MAG: carbohydrate kinase family protein [Bryobacterales bacterium]|nr:carbohydrate kinase family protein [Bryobacterales bacterium]
MTGAANPDRLVCAGEFFTDLIFSGLEAPPSLGQEVKTDDFAISTGGGAAITATAAALLGRPTELVTVWGSSVLDGEARIRLEASGVSCSLAQIRPDLICGVTVAVSTREDRYFLTYPGASRAVEQHLLEERILQRIGRSGHIHFVLTPSSWSAFRSAVRQLRDGGSTVSWDLGWDPAAGRSRAFRDLCRELDVVFLNEMEACKYAGARSAREALAYFSHTDNTVVIKRGAAGALASRNASPPVCAEAIDVEAVESTGAGDAFNGGFLHAWMARKSLEDALDAGNVCGGLSTRSPGGVNALPSRSEFDRQIRRLEHLRVAGTERE